MTKVTLKGLAAAFLAATAVACGGGGSSNTPTTPTTPTSPTTPTAPAPGGNPATATITIGADGRVTPASVTIAPGGRVTIVNNHNQPHDMSSDPHPEHTQCPEINQIGFLTAGQSRASGNFNTARTCGFHDHNLPDNANLRGSIVIQ
jgi:plastocyanin